MFFFPLGKTADITVLERQEDGLLKMVIPTCSGAWGGTAIDVTFMRFLENVFSSQIVMKLKSKDAFDYMLLIHEFEVKKRLVKTDMTSDIVITLPISLVELMRKYYGGINAAINRSYYGDSVSIIGTQKLSIKPQTFRELFMTTIDNLLEYIEELFQHPKISDVQYIIMVGGFSECELVQKAMKDKFPNKEIYIPEEAGLAVLRGAVLYGHQQYKKCR